MYYLIKWHRGTPTVPPVGAVNVPAENPKIQKIHIFEDFSEHFFLINHIGFSLKYVIPKSSTDFFSSKKKVFDKIFHFSFFIISHAQPMQVASRNSPWARRTGRYEKKCPFFPLNPVWGPFSALNFVDPLYSELKENRARQRAIFLKPLANYWGITFRIVWKWSVRPCKSSRKAFRYPKVTSLLIQI